MGHVITRSPLMQGGGKGHAVHASVYIKWGPNSSGSQQRAYKCGRSWTEGLHCGKSGSSLDFQFGICLRYLVGTKPHRYSAPCERPSSRRRSPHEEGGAGPWNKLKVG